MKIVKNIIEIGIGIIILFLGFTLLINTMSNRVRIFPEGAFKQAIDIPKNEGYKINYNHPYEIITTEEGYDLIIHFIKE